MTALRNAGGSGPARLLLHGFGSDALSWTRTVSALTAGGAVYVLDLPGHGDGGLDIGDGSPLALAERVESAIDARGLTRVDLVGHSLGGGVALLIAQRRPRLVASLALIAPAGLGAGVDADFLHAYPDLADVATATGVMQRLVVRPHLIGRQVVAYALAALARPGARDSLRSIAAHVTAASGPFDEAAVAIGQTAVPRMVIWGDSDRINPLDPQRLAAFGGETHVIPATGHVPHIENPQATNALLAAFLDTRNAAVR